MFSKKKNNFIHCKVVVVYIVVFVHSPLQPLQSLSRLSPGNCSREGSSIVRHFIQTVWRPIFKKFDVKMPDQCPLHFSRDLFSAQELAKLHYRVNLWTCGLCGKSFYREHFLDMHMASKHSPVPKFTETNPDFFLIIFWMIFSVFTTKKHPEFYM